MTLPRDPADPPPDDRSAPRVIGGRYRLGPVIGRGGMATIHRALDLRNERAVAIKFLRPEVSRDADLAGRFRREALAATVLRHPNIVACLDTGTDGDQPYLVMELVDGEDLAARLRRGGRLAPWLAARIALDVARGLGAAHVRGIVHRDIKPGNIMLASDGRAMVADFGIARLAADAEATMPGTTLGSIHYFSPEQARGLTTTPASDVYGLGLVLYETLTGRRAWTGDSSDAIALARVGAAPPSPRAAAPEVPLALDGVVRRALAPEAEDRYANGAAMAAALEPIVAAADRDATVPATLIAAPPTSTAADPGAPVAPAPIAPAPVAAAPVAPPIVPSAPPIAPPASPASAGRSAAPSSVGRSVVPMPAARRPRAPVAAAIGVLALVGGLLGAAAVVMLPGGEEAFAGPSGRPTAGAPATPRASIGPTTEPTAAPSEPPGTAPAATPTRAPRTPPPGKVADLCETFFGLPCGLDAGRYAPSRFQPGFDIKLKKGWSNALHDRDLVTLTRDQGLMTFASGLTEVYPAGKPTVPRDRARDIIEAFVVTDGVTSTRPAKVKIGGEKGYSVDLSPVDDRQVLLFRTPGHAFALQPGRTTRLVAVDVDGRVVVFAIEPAEDLELRAILDTADVAAGTIRWR